jgi:hypothetical protein
MKLNATVSHDMEAYEKADLPDCNFRERYCALQAIEALCQVLGVVSSISSAYLTANLTESPHYVDNLSLSIVLPQGSRFRT